MVACVIRALLFCALTACLSAQSPLPVRQSDTTGDSLGLQALNAALNLLPSARLTHRLTRGQLRASRPELDQTALGPTAMGWGIRNRADHLQIDFGFEWNAGSLDSREITDDAVLDRMDVMWLGSDLEEFTTTAERVMTALRGASAAPSCLEHPKDENSVEEVRRSRDAAWYADGWISTVYLSASLHNGRRQFVVHHRAFLLRKEFAASYRPLRAGWDCLPDVRFIVAPFKDSGH